MNIPLIQIGSVLLCLVAGGAIFLLLLNRVLIVLRDGRAKVPTIIASFVVIVVASVSYGFLFYQPPWVFLAPAVLALGLLGECHRLFIRFKCVGSAPIDTVPHKFNLISPVTTMDIVTHRYCVPHAKWRGKKLRIVHLSDLHVHPNMPLEYYQEVIATAEESKPDIAIFTGDFISKIGALPLLEKVLRPIAKHKTYAVLGNHDYWIDTDGVRKIIRECGLHLLTNESDLMQFGQNKIAVTGYDYPWGTKHQSISPQEDNILHVVLSHTPDNIYRAAKVSADFVFSGHYHAGQIRIPVIGPLVVPSLYGRRFDHGHFVVKNTNLFVASGVGVADPIIRIFCQPDIFVVDVEEIKKNEMR